MGHREGDRKADETGVMSTDELTAAREEIAQLREQMDEVLANAAANERIWRHFLEIERMLFRSRQLDRLVRDLLEELSDRFRLDEVLLFLTHPDVLDRFFPTLTADGEDIGATARLFAHSPETWKSLFEDNEPTRVFDAGELRELAQLPPESIPGVQSGVLASLTVHHTFFGALFLGSSDPDRYPPGASTDLLDQLMAKVALCMENCVAYEQVRDMSVRDRWTGLLNFFQIHTVLDREFRRAVHHGTPVSVLIVDLDFYRNDEEGADLGRAVLEHVARILEEILPGVEGFLGRSGGDEFLVILPDSFQDEARGTADYIARTIRKSPVKYSNTAILIRPTIGMATLDEEMQTPYDLLDAAYADFYRLKAATGDFPTSVCEASETGDPSGEVQS